MKNKRLITNNKLVKEIIRDYSNTFTDLAKYDATKQFKGILCKKCFAEIFFKLIKI